MGVRETGTRDTTGSLFTQGPALWQQLGHWVCQLSGLARPRRQRTLSTGHPLGASIPRPQMASLHSLHALSSAQTQGDVGFL